MMNGQRTGPTLGALILFTLSVLLVVAGTAYAVWQGSRQAQAIASDVRALCAEQRDVGTVQPAAPSSALGVKLIADFRDAYAGLGCSPALPPPSPSLLKLAAKYGVPVRH
jgi:hypothetical protein